MGASGTGGEASATTSGPEGDDGTDSSSTITSPESTTSRSTTTSSSSSESSTSASSSSSSSTGTAGTGLPYGPCPCAPGSECVVFGSGHAFCSILCESHNECPPGTFDVQQECHLEPLLGELVCVPFGACTADIDECLDHQSIGDALVGPDCVLDHGIAALAPPLGVCAWRDEKD